MRVKLNGFLLIQFIQSFGCLRDFMSENGRMYFEVQG